MSEKELNCFDCKSWCDRDQLVYYANEGLYRCFEDAYQFEFKRHLKDLELLSEAKKVLEPFAKVADDWFPELSTDNDVKTIVGSNENPVTIGQFRKAVEFLKKLEDSTA